MTSRYWRGLVALLAVITVIHIACSWGAFPSAAPLTGGWRTPIIAFELARTEVDLAFLTGSEAEPLRLAMDAGHVWDTSFPFIYGLLLATALASLQRPLGWLGAALALAAIPLDLWENQQLIAITDALRHGEPGAPWLPTLLVATWFKWGSLAASVGCYALDRRGNTPAVSGIGALAVGVTIAAGLTNKPVLGEAMAAIVVLGIVAVSLRTVWPRSTP